jgi:hypothetical protein
MKESIESPGFPLSGGYDVHVHCAPDVVARAQDLIELAEAMRLAGMAGAVIKDHTTSTAGRATRSQSAGRMALPRHTRALADLKGSASWAVRAR